MVLCSTYPVNPLQVLLTLPNHLLWWKEGLGLGGEGGHYGQVGVRPAIGLRDNGAL